ncbi:uncharacterized protein At5g23160-like [Durio zibethinus]|uniref:Uncharacterized protein At5g23160-like n=1 Tax=Durio zibethinus TaxID=66656 RepID=A0A6P5Y2Y4_DURZI|nr:uncharacterized protein At5g23160-like [Durio zibethinus]
MNLKQRLQKKKMKKPISKQRSSSFCLCFDSVVVLENGSVVGEASEPSEGVEPVVSLAVNMSPVDKDKDVGFFGRKNKLGRWGFSRYFKAVFFETSLMKKVRNKKLGQKLHRAYNNIKHSKPKSKSKSTKNIPSMNNNPSCEDNHSTRSTSTFSSTSTNSSLSSTTAATITATTSRCSSSSLSCNSRPCVSQSVETNVPRKYCSGFNVGKCLVSLLVLVIWGKICAIFCTSTWLFFTCRSIKHVRSENIAVDHHRDSPETDTEIYNKKKIIMEGLLERDHSRNRFPY